MTKTSTKHEATLPDGSIATRTSENRTYFFATAVRYGYEQSKSFASNQKIHSDAENGSYYLDRAAGKAEVLYGDAQEEARAEALAELDGATTVAEYVAKATAKRLAKVEEDKAAGEFEKWHVDGWSSRADLAEKNAAKVRGYHRVAEVRVVPARVVAKKGGAK